MRPIEVFVVGLAAGGNAGGFFVICEFFFVGKSWLANFIGVGKEGGSVLVLGHIYFFAVEVAGCVVVAAIGAGLAAGGVGCPIFGDGVGGGLTAKAGGA